MKRQGARGGIFKWYYFTRGLGAITVLYELLIAGTGSPERGTIILAGFAAIGIDFVARKDKENNGS